MKELTHLSLFAGIGGIDIAAEAAGFKTVAQCEWADYQSRVLKKHWKNAAHFKDIKELTKEAFYEKTKLKTVTLISGGFPCQPFSLSGKRRGFKDDRYLWPEMLRVIRELSPDWVLGENVAGFINMGLDKAVADLEEAGYTTGTFVLPALSVGAWHERRRTFIIGHRISDTDCIGCKKALKEKQNGDNKERNGNRTGKKKPEDTIGFKHSDILSASGIRGDGSGIPQGREYGKCHEICGYHNRKCETESGLGGMAYGISDRMDGHKFWEREPEGIKRVKERDENWSKRLEALGNAVVPQQVYPILQGIYYIETKKCREGDGSVGRDK